MSLYEIGKELENINSRLKFLETRIETQDIQNESLPEDRIVKDPFDLGDQGIAVLSGVAIELPKGKKMDYRVRISADKENALIVTLNFSDKRWYRNSYEVPESTSVDGKINSLNSNRTILFESWSKDCYLRNNTGGCPGRNWYHNYGPQRLEETDTYYRLSWDDSRNPPRAANVEVEIWIRN